MRDENFLFLAERMKIKYEKNQCVMNSKWYTYYADFKTRKVSRIGEELDREMELTYRTIAYFVLATFVNDNSR